MKNTSQHTPGPWILEAAEDGGRVLASDPRSTIIHVPPCSPFNDAARADARLIAAAPDMLEALEALVACVEWNDSVPAWTAQWDTARAVIAKAKGGQQP